MTTQKSTKYRIVYSGGSQPYSVEVQKLGAKNWVDIHWDTTFDGCVKAIAEHSGENVVFESDLIATEEETPGGFIQDEE